MRLFLLLLMMVVLTWAECEVWRRKRSCLRDCTCAWCNDTGACYDFYELATVCNVSVTLADKSYCMPEESWFQPAMGAALLLICCCGPVLWCLWCREEEIGAMVLDLETGANKIN